MFLGRPWPVVRYDHVESAVQCALAQGGAVFLGAEGRHQFHVAVETIEIRFRPAQMVHGRSAADVEAGRFCFPYGVQTGGGRDHGEVETATGIAQDVQIPADAEQFRFLRVAGEPHGRTHRTLVHHPIGLEVGVVRFREYRQARRRVVFQGPTEQFRPLQWSIVREGPGTGIAQGESLRELLSRTTDAHRGYGNDPTYRCGSPVQQRNHFGWLVPAGNGRCHGSHPRESALCCCVEAVLQSLRPLHTRVPEIRLAVPPSRRYPAAFEVDGFPGLSGSRLQTLDASIPDGDVHLLAVQGMTGLEQFGGVVLAHGAGVGRDRFRVLWLRRWAWRTVA